MEEREMLTRKEIMRLRQVVRELDNRIQNTRHYLMSTPTKEITAENALEALGFTRDGLTEIEEVI